MKRVKILVFCIIPFLLSCHQNDYTGKESAALKTQLAKGWNTWDTRSVLSHVLLPEGFGLHLQLKESQSGDILEEALIGRGNYGSKEHVTPGPRAYDGSYTELEVEWRNIHVWVQSATINNDLHLLISPLKAVPGDSLIIVPQMLWDREGEISIDQNLMTGQSPMRTTRVHVNGDQWVTYPENIMVSLGQVIAIS